MMLDIKIIWSCFALIYFDDHVGKGQGNELAAVDSHDVIGRSQFLNEHNSLVLYFLKRVCDNVGGTQ
jgi:hypothetical protein